MQGAFRWPRAGTHNDQSHPPIHPVRYAGDLDGDEKRLYDYIVRCVSDGQCRVRGLCSAVSVCLSVCRVLHAGIFSRVARTMQSGSRHLSRSM